MDYELIFWVAAPFVLIAGIFAYGLFRDWAEEKNCRWEEEHGDDWNKDVWEE